MRVYNACLVVVALVALAALSAGCGGTTPTEPSAIPAFSQTDVKVGDGTPAAVGNSMTVHYTGWFYDSSKPDNKGIQFETSQGGLPFVFTLGAGQVIAGWDKGLVGMNVNGVRRLVVPPSLAYGDRRNGIIPPNSTLVFEITLLDVQ